MAVRGGGDVQPYIELLESNYTAPCTPSTITVNVASNVRVSVVLPDAATWIKEKKTSANSPNTFRFDIEQNNEYDARTAEIHFVHQASNLRKVATVTQEPQGAIQLASSYYEVNPEGGTLNIEVQSNTAIEVKIPTSSQWIKQVEPRGMETMALIRSRFWRMLLMRIERV